MNRVSLLLLLSVLFAASPMAQESAPESGTAEEQAPAADDAAAEDEEASSLDDVSDEEIEELLGLDEDYDEADEGFDPTIEVRVKDAIVFPVDI